MEYAEALNEGDQPALANGNAARKYATDPTAWTSTSRNAAARISHTGVLTGKFEGAGTRLRPTRHDLRAEKDPCRAVERDPEQ